MGTNKPKYKILVAEDDPFQRLSIIDILKISNYDVTSAENGAIALDKLRDPNNQFDLVLLDLLMPEKSGKDVLEALNKDDKLSKIPVIVMSAKNDKSITAECLALGAVSFIVKPLRVQEWRSFENFIGSNGETEAGQNLGKYAVIKALGSGAAGSVDLVQHKETGEYYALKTIPLSHLNERERSSAELEVHFLRVLVGPTLIKSYHSYVEKNNIYIIMELAEGGNLSDKIMAAKFKKKYFDKDTILNWAAQIILGVMVMHSKNILHRDLKCQNLFLTREGILKIGDFGISKQLDTMSNLAETNVGTPYFMAPEVCKGELYGEKADIWAIGWILYELTFLRKPFDADTIQGVFDKIIKTPVKCSDLDIGTDLQMLIISTLDKDPSKRPDIWDLASLPCINDRINKFIKEQKCEESVNGVFGGRNLIEERDTEDPDNPFYSVFDINKLEMLAHLIRTDINIEEINGGWFKRTEKSATGNSILNWLKEHIEKDDKKVEEIGQKMMDQNIIQRIDNAKYFQGSHTVYYKFYEDRDDIPSNSLRPWKGEVRSALDVSVDLVVEIGEIFQDSIVEVDDNWVIDSEEAIKSQKYDDFISNIAQLEVIDLKFNTFNEGLCFFVNVYQVMYLHFFLKYGSEYEEEEEEKSSFSNILTYFWPNSTDNFFYNIGGYMFTLDQLKHGLLRGNKKPPYSFFRTLSDRDDRANILDKLSDPRILFVCFDKGQVPESVEWFDDPDTLEEKLNEILSTYLNDKVEIDPTNEEVTLPTIFEEYSADMGGSEEKVLRFIWNWYENNEFDLDDLIKLVKKKSIIIKYEG